eukprot:1158975-Pelagomonas_calceolata.AAC.15
MSLLSRLGLCRRPAPGMILCDSDEAEEGTAGEVRHQHSRSRSSQSRPASSRGSASLSTTQVCVCVDVHVCVRARVRPASYFWAGQPPRVGV